jgi:hypothetical protein
MNTRLRIRIDEGLSLKRLFSKLKVKASSSSDVIRALMYFVENPHMLAALKIALGEAITVPIEIGDTVLGGKFKNKRIVVKDIGKNEKGDITINGKPLMKYRLIPQED